MAIPAQPLFKLMNQTSPISMLSTNPSDVLKLTTAISAKNSASTSPFPMTVPANNNNTSSAAADILSPIKGSTPSSISSPNSASKRNKRKSLEPKKVNTVEMEENNTSCGAGLVRKLNFDAVSNPGTRWFESSSPSGSQKSDVSADSGNSSSCCRSPSPESQSPKRCNTKTITTTTTTLLPPPKKRFKEDPTLNLVLSDIKESLSTNGNTYKTKFYSDTKKVTNPFRPWDNDDEEEEINDDEEGDDCFVDVERQSPNPCHPQLRDIPGRYEKSLSSTSSSSSPVGNTSLLLGGSTFPLTADRIPSVCTVPPLPMAPQLITANHQQLVQASQNLLALSKLYPSLVDMNTLASVAAAAQLAASTAAAAAAAAVTPSTPPPPAPPLQPNLISNHSSTALSQHRPHLVNIQEQYSIAARQRVEPEQEEPLALIKKPSSNYQAADKAIPMNHFLAKKMASLKENHQPHVTHMANKTEEMQQAKNPGKRSTVTEQTEKCLQGQRNYKNMTRERRVEANARERQRVHTITAAFDTLQSLIPSPDDVQNPQSSEAVDAEGGGDVKSPATINKEKISKLSIIKIATSYIMLLSRMAGYDYTEDKSAPSIDDCVKKCSELLTQETKVKRSRDTILKVESR